MSENKTQPTEVDPSDFIASVEHPTRRADAQTLLAMMTRVTGCQPKMWGSSLIGFGRYHYKYDSGREGDFMLTGFSPRKASLVLYVMPGYDDVGDQLADVNLHVLEQIVADGVATMRATYETWND